MRERPSAAVSAAIGALVLFAVTGEARAHGADPAGVHLREAAGGAVTVRILGPGAAGAAIEAILPPGCLLLETARDTSSRDRSTVESRWQCDGPLAGRSLRITGLGAAGVPAVVRAELADGRVYREVATEGSPVVDIPLRAPWQRALLSYGKLGVSHLATGPDHLLFIAGLVLAARRLGRSLRALTAFTLGHSATLCAAALGFFSFPAPLAEVGIAASLCWMAASVARADPPPKGLSLTAFFMGLLHGLGFASALASAGLPQGDVAPALFGFNMGIEAGQAAVVCAMWLVRAAAVRLGVEGRPRGRVWAGHALGAVAAMWCIERVATLLS